MRKPAIEDDTPRRFWRHMREAAEAMQSGDRDALSLSHAVLYGMCDLDLKKHPRLIKLVKPMLANLEAARRGK